MRMNPILERVRFRNRTHFALAGFAMLAFGCGIPTMAQQTQQRTFASAKEASQALYQAVRNDDDQAVDAILGAAPQLTSSGNDAEDKLDHQQFVKKYEAMHRLVREPDGSTVLYVGAENWPFPVPLVETDGKWRFDSESGSQELLARAVGENETAAFEVCQAVGKPGSDSTDQTGADKAVLEFARGLVNSGSANSGSNQEFRGYYFRVTKEQRGNMVVVAYPTQYRTSGIMTFVAAGGRVYEKDLGLQTAIMASKIQGKPAGNWTQVQYGKPE